MSSPGSKNRNSVADGAPAPTGPAVPAMLKNLAGHLPSRLQQELKRLYFARGVRRGTFQSEEIEFRRLEEWVGTGDWVLDLGANVGYFTVKLSRLVGANGRVLAFEPIRETFELLSANVARLPLRNVTLFNVAVSDRTYLAGMNIPHFDNNVENYYMARLADGGGTSPVLCLPVDALGLTAKIGLAKVDVEGHELSALKGMEHVIARDRPVLIVEGDSPDVAAFLARFGYRAEHAEGSPNHVYICSGR
jgi:FkbM family methyltransferase